MLGLSIPEIAERSSGLDPGAVALIARMSVAPSAARGRAIDAVVRGLKASGVWGKLVALHVMAAHDAQAARLNWVQVAYDLGAVNAPGFVADRGYAGNGSNSYLDTGWAPNAGAQDSLCFAVWDRTGTQSAMPVAGTSTTTGVVIIPRNASDAAGVRVNQASASASAAGSVVDGSGFTAANRSAANAVQIYRNGALLASASTASSAPSAASLALGVYNNGNFSAHQFAACAIGSSLSAGEQAALYGALLGYMQVVGAA